MSVTNYYLPQSLGEALHLLDEHQDALLVMGGGTVAMPLINEGVSAPERVMGLKNTGLDYIHPQNGHVVIGATTTFSQILEQAPIPINSTKVVLNICHILGARVRLFRSYWKKFT